MKKAKRIIGQKPFTDEHSNELRQVGQVIRELRFNFGLLTQKELAEKCGVHFNTIQAIERGERNYNIQSIIKIIHFFDYNLKEFFEGL